MPRYVVITMNHDEQQTHFDIIDAGDEDSALERVMEVREYCCHGIAFTPAELINLAEGAEDMSPSEVTEHWDDTIRWHDSVDETA